MIAAIIPGAGTGQRMESETPKIFHELKGKPLLFHALKSILSVEEIGHIILAVPAGWEVKAEKLVSGLGLEKVEIIEGAATRQDTVYLSLRLLPKETKMVVIHDGVRPFATPALIRSVINGAREHGACIPTLPCEESVKRVRGGHVVETLSRDEIHIVQTPQAFYYDVIIDAHNHACERKWRVTDDAALVERAGRPVASITGEKTNIKITRPIDLSFASVIYESYDILP